MKKIVIITNQPSPYRVDFFYYLQQKYAGDYEIYIVFSSSNNKTSRTWNGGEQKLKSVVFLNSKVLRFKKKLDVHEVIISYGIGKALSEIAPDVVVCSEYNYTSVLAKHWCNRGGTPFISWSDGTRFSERHIGFAQKLSRKYIIKKSAAFIASSSKTKENQIFLGAKAKDIYISELSVDMKRYEGYGDAYDPNGPLLFVGSLIKRKGLDLLFEALSLIKDREWTLNIAGEGTEEKELRRQAEKLGISERVSFLGFVDGKELVELYAKSSLFILPTREDCFGLVTLEAMCLGLPVLGSKYADSSYDLIEDGVNGYIIDPHDTVSFAGIIEELLENPDKRAGMGAAGREVVKKFSFENTGKVFMEAVDSCLKNDIKDRTIIYASFMCSEPFFHRLFNGVSDKPGQAVQKYNRLLAEGLAEAERTKVYAVSEIPVNERNFKGIFFRGRAERNNGVYYRYLPLINKHGVKDIGAVFAGFLKCIRIIRKSEGNIYIMADILNAPIALGAFFAARLFKKQYIAVVTDLPEYVYLSDDKIYSYVSDILIKKADKYVFLTEQMSVKKNILDKPYVIVEGLVDIKEKNKEVPTIRGDKKIVYTGSIHEKYGIGKLLEGFLKADVDGTELHIYGNGDMKERLSEVTLKHSNIFYHGDVLMEDAVKAQKNAVLLVNPRPSGEEYTQYSFPSKTMEYMVSGRPVLMTKLKGMPAEYYEYLYLIDDESPEGIAEALRNVLAKGGKEMLRKGESARKFVLNKKNNIAQAEKLIRELKL